MFNKSCQRLDSNQSPLASEATTLATVPQPLAKVGQNFIISPITKPNFDFVADQLGNRFIAIVSECLDGKSSGCVKWSSAAFYEKILSFRHSQWSLFLISQNNNNDEDKKRGKWIPGIQIFLQKKKFFWGNSRKEKNSFSNVYNCLPSNSFHVV